MNLQEHKQEFIETHYTPSGTAGSKEIFEEELNDLLVDFGENISEYIRMRFWPPEVTKAAQKTVSTEIQNYAAKLALEPQ